MPTAIRIFCKKKLENPCSNALVQNSVAIRADESLKVNTSCRHRATFFLVARKDDASGRHFYVRELKNRRLGATSELIEENALLTTHICAAARSRAHARSADPAVLAGYLGKSGVFDDALASFAMAYADRTQRDYDKLASSKREIVKTLAA